MDPDIFKKVKLQNEINMLSPDRLDEVLKYVEKLKSKSNVKKSENRTLSGIWKNKGFEKIVDLENEIKSIRKEFSNSVMNKKL